MKLILFTTRDVETTEQTLVEDLKSTREETDTIVIMYALYGKHRVTTLFKFEPLTPKCVKECRLQCLLQHIHIPLASEGHEWTKNTDTGLIEPLWIDGDLLPPQIVDILEDMVYELEKNNDTD
ncbi:hypothetical protein DPMN_111697 [Dreissena polymorpha]|uniref:Uncharacterized protein n=1 Tax=Dreissena polymorpha TaxID=45954 RepID=A0A9D4QP91_DREPO|nr:hypothetical protein DPMN_111697 [Dreissena polymorpha]